MNRTRDERMQIMVSPTELKAIDNWRFRSRMPSRAAAVRELLRRGLQAVGFEMPDEATKSGDFGILESGKSE